ncbi:unnamed protein product [Sphagnum balticum]
MTPTGLLGREALLPQASTGWMGGFQLRIEPGTVSFQLDVIGDNRQGLQFFRSFEIGEEKPRYRSSSILKDNVQASELWAALKNAQV